MRQFMPLTFHKIDGFFELNANGVTIFTDTAARQTERKAIETIGRRFMSVRLDLEGLSLGCFPRPQHVLR